MAHGEASVTSVSAQAGGWVENVGAAQARAVGVPSEQPGGWVFSTPLALAQLVSDPRLIRSGGWIDDDVPLWVYVYNDSGQKVLLMFSTIVPLRAGSSIYFGAGGISTDEDEVCVGVPAGTVMELVVTSSEQAGVGTYTVTLRKEKQDTGVAVTLTGTGLVGNAPASVGYADKERMSMHLQSAGGSPDAIINVAVKYQFAT